MVAERLLHVPGADNVGSLSLVRRFVLLLAIDGALYLFAGRLVLRVGGGAGTCLLVLLAAMAARLPSPRRALGQALPFCGRESIIFSGYVARAEENS